MEHDLKLFIQSPRGRQSMELKARVRGNKAGQDSATVDVDLLVDGEKWKTVPLQYRLTRFVPVLRVIGAVRGGTPLGPDNLMLAREKQTAAPGFYVRSFDAVTGMIARRNLQGGQLLTITDVGEPALIHRGDIVTVVLTRGRVKVTAKAIASQDAARGERLQLTNMTTHAPITGIATAPGTVEVPN